MWEKAVNIGMVLTIYNAGHDIYNNAGYRCNKG